MREWPTIGIDQACELIVDCVNKTAPKVPYETPWKMLRTTNVRNGRINTEEVFYVDEDTFAKWTRRATLEVGDTILTREAPVGEVGMVREAEGFFLGQRLMQYRANPNIMDGLFLHYAMRSPFLTHQFHAHGGMGSVVDHLRVPDCRKFRLPFPPLPEQREIAAILGALDDKIEVDRKASATLEAMARALYRSWFVDFDPVWAKLEGRPPAHMAPTTAALFPDSFDDDGLPLGWTNGTLADLVGFNPQERITKGTIAPYFDMRALPTSGLNVDSPIQREFSSGTKFRAMDTLLARITPCLENGKTAMVPDLGEHEIAWGSTEFIVMRARPGVPASLPYCVARDPAFREEAIATMTGSSGRQRADAKRISEMPIAIPNPEIISAFGNASMPLIERIHRFNQEIKTLATLRDSLLPKLMSGEIRVGDAQDLLKEAI